MIDALYNGGLNLVAAGWWTGVVPLSPRPARCCATC